MSSLRLGSVFVLVWALSMVVIGCQNDPPTVRVVGTIARGLPDTGGMDWVVDTF